jgi:hypothetical protein
MPDESAPASPAPPSKRIVYLNRRVAFIEPDRVNVRPALAAALFPLFGLLLGIAAFLSILLWLDRLPFALIVVLLLVAIIAIPFAGIGFVYAIAGSNVVFEREKQSGVWQQGFLGMGVGTIELVPFWKIDQIRIEEVTRERQRGEVQDLAQLEIVLVKVSGKRLSVGDIIVPRSMVREGLADVREVADAISALTGKPLIAPTVVRRPKGAADDDAVAPETEATAPDSERDDARTQPRRGDLNTQAGPT